MHEVLCVMVGVLACTLRSATAEEDQPRARLPSITVTSEAAREIVPDIATLAVTRERPTAGAAAEETARRSQAVLAELRA